MNRTFIYKFPVIFWNAPVSESFDRDSHKESNLIPWYMSESWLRKHVTRHSHLTWLIIHSRPFSVVTESHLNLNGRKNKWIDSICDIEFARETLHMTEFVVFTAEHWNMCHSFAIKRCGESVAIWNWAISNGNKTHWFSFLFLKFILQKNPVWIYQLSASYLIINQR